MPSGRYGRYRYRRKRKRKYSRSQYDLRWKSNLKWARSAPRRVRQAPSRSRRPLSVVVGKSHISKHVFSTTATLSPTTVQGATRLAYKRYRANVLEDIAYDGQGFDARGFDEMAALFGKYVVLGAKIEATPILPDSQVKLSTGYTGAVCTRYIFDDPESPIRDQAQPNTNNLVQVRDILENGWKVNKQFYINNSNTYGAAASKHTVRVGFSGNKTFGVGFTKEEEQWRTPGISPETPVDTNPDRNINMYFTVYALNDPAQGLSVSDSVTYRIQITYSVLWFQRATIGMSGAQ